MDENTQKLIQVVSKNVSEDKKDLALQFLMDTIQEKQQQNYKNSIEMNKFILYEVNEYIKSLSRKPKIISFDDSIPKYENIDSILERTIQERQHIDFDTFPSSNHNVDKERKQENETVHESLNVHVIREEDNKLDDKQDKKQETLSSIDTTISKEESSEMMSNYNSRMMLYDDPKTAFMREKQKTEDIQFSLSSVVWIDTLETKEDNTLVILLEKEWKKSIILQVALDKQYGTGDFIHLNGSFFQKVGYTQDYTQYDIYKGKYQCQEDNVELEIKSYPEKQLVEWSEECNPLLIQIFHQH